MTTLRDQSKPVLYALVVLFVLAMGGFGNIFNNTNPNRGDGEYCDPELFIACSDDKNISITIEEFNRRFNDNPDFWLSQVAQTFQINGQTITGGGIDKQVDTVSAKGRLMDYMLNQRINNKFIKSLELTPRENYSEEMINFIKNYPNSNFGRTYKEELESYGLFIVDSTFNQEQYEIAVDDGTLDEKINESFAINNPQLANLLISRGTTRWNNWLTTMKRQISTRSFNNILNSTKSISNLELKNKLLLDSASFNFDYLIYSIANENNMNISDEELNEYYQSIKDNNDYELKNESKAIVEFVKWNTTDLEGDIRDSIKKLAKDFRKTARKEGFENAVEKNNTFSRHETVTLANAITMFDSGLSTQILNPDSTTTPLYNIIGGGRKIINFAFSNEVGEIKLIDIESDRETDGFNDIGIFYIKDIVPESYTSIEDAQIKDKLLEELSFKKKYKLGEKEFSQLMNQYKNYLISEDLNEVDLENFDPLDQWINGPENEEGKIVLSNHQGSVNNFIESFIKTNLRDLVNTSDEIKALFLNLNKGTNYHIFAIDNDNIAMIRLNEISNIPTSENIEAYKQSELQRLSTNQAALFLQDQKETANIKDNRLLVY